MDKYIYNSYINSQKNILRLYSEKSGILHIFYYCNTLIKTWSNKYYK